VGTRSSSEAFPLGEIKTNEVTRDPIAMYSHCR